MSRSQVRQTQCEAAAGSGNSSCGSCLPWLRVGLLVDQRVPNLLQGACGSCPSALTTMTMGIKRRLMEKIPVRACRTLSEILAEQALWLPIGARALLLSHQLLWSLLLLCSDASASACVHLRGTVLGRLRGSDETSNAARRRRFWRWSR